ncbi:MAG: hypothetical protein V7785_24165, partial [Bermanella sp.]
MQNQLISIQETLHLIDIDKHSSRAQRIISGLYSDISLKQAYLFNDKHEVIASTKVEDIGKPMNNVLPKYINIDIKNKIELSQIKQKNILWETSATHTLHGISPIQFEKQYFEKLSTV